MKREFALASSSALFSMAIFCTTAVMAPAHSLAQSGNGQGSGMVAAQGALTDNLDSSKTKVGDSVRVTLSSKVMLKDGTLLPAGTAIEGVVATDDMQLSGTTKLALQFTRAQTKSGKVIPIKATIVGVFPAESEDISGRPIKPGEETRGLQQRPSSVDETDALPGVDLHSNISDSNSGVLVATTKHDLKVKRGSEFALTISVHTTAQGE